jgi:hypothetical protein
MECYTNFGQEYLQVLAAQVLLCRDADFLKDVATPNAWVCVNTRKRIVVIPGFEVRLFLLGELGCNPRDDRYNHMSTGTRHVRSTITDHLIDPA